MSARNVGWFMAGVLAVISASCGGGGSSADPAPTPPPLRAFSNVVVAGNSLSTLPTDAGYVPGSNAWGPGGWGMAASAPEKDYVHLLAAKLQVPFIAMNLAENERNPDAPLPAFTVGAGTVVILQLGDNGLPAKYAELVARAKAGSKLVCVSTWGLSQALRDRDAVMRPLCESGGGRWVDITDLIVSPENVGVLGHPGDTGMARIADRINAALKE
ncbi:hypothetical protein [Roseateles sp.]|uniref:hypothetical protein n=1 Tax=Roseateles sp. TaxID=1971397 RepID=UPI0031CF9949